MGRRLLGLIAILTAVAGTACTSVDGGATRNTGYTRPDCGSDYLYGQKVTPCYTQR